MWLWGSWLFLFASQLVALFAAPTDAMQGQVYRILYLHVPFAAVALGLAGIGLLFTAVRYFLTKEHAIIQQQRAWVELGLVFTFLTLFTGSVWGKPTWGTWWTWDARLTTTLLLAVLLSGYLMLYHSVGSPKIRGKVCSALSLMICVNIPIIYKSVSWFRTLHQPASLIPSRGQTLDPAMRPFLYLTLLATVLFALQVFALVRRRIVHSEKFAEEELARFGS